MNEQVNTTVPFDYLKNCFGSVSLPVTGWCADKIYVNNPSSIEFLKKVADCGGNGIAYLKAIDTYPRIDELRIRAVGPVLSYDINGWIQFDPETWMMTTPWPYQYPITDNEILLEEVTWDEYQNTQGQTGAAVSVSTGTFANLHGLNLKFTCEVWGTVTIDPTQEDENHQQLQIIESKVGYVGGVWFISGSQSISGTLSGNGTVYTMLPQQFTFGCRGGSYGNTQNNLLYQQANLRVQVSPAYVGGYKSTHISGGFRLISIDDICGGTNFYPSKGTHFKSNPIYDSGNSPYLSYVIEFNDRWI